MKTTGRLTIFFKKFNQMLHLAILRGDFSLHVLHLCSQIFKFHYIHRNQSQFSLLNELFINDQIHLYISILFIIFYNRLIMKKNSKISNLNLKFLDLKFVSINHNETYITQALQSYRKSKISELPSLLKSTTHQFNDTTVDDSMAILKGDARKKYKSQNSESSFINTQNSYSQQYSKILLKSAWKYQTNKNIQTQNESGSQIQIKKQSAQLEKYRRKIQKLKKQNKDIHNQISLLYRNKLKDKYQPLKQVRKIQPFVQINEQTPISSQNASKVFQQEKQSQKNKIMRNYWNFYQNLTNPLNPYNEELQIAQKKMLNNNLHRNFQNYCQKSNKRIPQFIKKIR